MGNEISHKRYCCRKSRKFERQATEQENAEADLPIAPRALGAVLWSSVNLLPKEKSQDTATGTQNKDIESEIASSSLQHVQKSVAQIAVQTTELQDLVETQPSAQEPEETETKPATMMSPDRPACVPSQERAATAQTAAGDTGVTKFGLPLQTAVETGARDANDGVTEQATVESNAVECKRSSGRLCKPSPLCRWLKKLKSSAEKNKANPDAITSQE